MALELRLGDLLGKVLVDPNGEVVGRIDDLVAEPRGDACAIDAVIVGALRAPWTAIDVGDPARPRLRIPRAALPRR